MDSKTARNDVAWVHTPWARALGLALCMSLGGLWGCGGGGGGNTPASTGDTANTGSQGASGTTTEGSGGGSSGGDTTATGVPTLGQCQLFPANAIFNTRIDDLPVHSNSTQWVSDVGGAVAFHPDWGDTEDAYADDYYGIPWNLVDGTAATTDWPLTAMWWPDESNCGIRQGDGSMGVRQDCSAVTDQARFPFPKTGWKIEGGYKDSNDGDRHVLVVETGACRLWETGNAYKQADGSWQVGDIAMWDLNANTMRPAGWTSADAAGLPLLPLLVKADEAASGEIKHALRVTFRNPLMADRAYVWPASHYAGNDGSGNIPFGALLRLKAGVTIPDNWGTQAKAIAVAMQRYGLYVADNGSNLYVQGEPSVRWDPNLIAQLKTLKMSDFEFVDTSGITSRAGFDARSYAVPAR